MNKLIITLIAAFFTLSAVNSFANCDKLERVIDYKGSSVYSYDHRFKVAFMRDVLYDMTIEGMKMQPEVYFTAESGSDRAIVIDLTTNKSSVVWRTKENHVGILFESAFLKELDKIDKCF